VTTATGPHAGFQNRYVVTELSEFVGSNEASHAGAED
jgi:hypothetical protein